MLSYTIEGEVNQYINQPTSHLLDGMLTDMDTMD